MEETNQSFNVNQKLNLKLLKSYYAGLLKYYFLFLKL